MRSYRSGLLQVAVLLTGIASLLAAASAGPTTRPATNPATWPGFPKTRPYYEQLVRNRADFESEHRAELAIVRRYEQVYLEPRPPVLELLRDCAQRWPDGIRILSLQVDADRNGVLIGRAADEETLKTLVEILQDFPSLQQLMLAKDAERDGLLAAGVRVKLPFKFTFRLRTLNETDKVIISRVAEDDWDRKLSIESAELSHGRDAIKEVPTLVQQSADMVAFLKKDAATQSWRLAAVAELWSSEVGLKLEGVSPVEKDKRTPGIDVECLMTATGSQAQIGKLLWRFKKAPLPIRITLAEIWIIDPEKPDLRLRFQIGTLSLPDGRDPLAELAAATRPQEK